MSKRVYDYMAEKGVTLQQINDVLPVEQKTMSGLDDTELALLDKAFADNPVVPVPVPVPKTPDVVVSTEVKEPVVIEKETLERAKEPTKEEGEVDTSTQPEWCSDLQWKLFNSNVYNMNINPARG